MSSVERLAFKGANRGNDAKLLYYYLTYLECAKALPDKINF